MERFNEEGKVLAAIGTRVGDLKNRWDEGLVISCELAQSLVFHS